VPQDWVQMMKNSIRTNAPVFNTDRMVADYVRQLYSPQPVELASVSGSI